MSDAQKIAFHQRLHAEKRFDDYVVIREGLKKKGTPASQAWRIAAQQFPPADGSPHEVAGCSSDLVSAPAAPLPKKKPGPKPKPQPAPSSNGDDEFTLDMADLNPPDPMLEGVPGKRSTPFIHGQSAAVESAKVHVDVGDAWKNLIAKVGHDSVCGPIESLQWVYDYAGTPPASIDPDSVPSHGSLRLLRWVQFSENNYGEFIKIWSKLIPSKTEIDRAGRFADDGRKQFSMIEDFEESLNGMEQPA